MIKNAEDGMTAEYIFKFAKACEAVFGTSDPEEIFRLRKAKVRDGAPEGLRGLVSTVNGTVVVCLDPSQPASLRKCAAAKLLGHSLLHRGRVARGETFEIPYGEGGGSASDKEADIFAAELLIPDAKITESFAAGCSEGQIASLFGGMRELVPYKLFSMRARGIAVGDDVCRADFMKRCDVELFF